MKSSYLLLVATGALIVPCISFAEEDAGRIEKRFEKPPEPKSTLQPLHLPLDEKLPPEKAGQVRFILKNLNIAGNTVFTRDDLLPLFDGLIGKEVSLLDIYKLRDAITAKYGNAGYGLTKAIIPEQRIQADGLVHIEIIEGFVDEVIVEGASAEQKEFLDHAIEKIKAERPLNVRTLERYLLLANDRFAIKLTSTLKASEKTPGASTLILKVEPAPKWEGGASLDNRGTDAVGPLQIGANLTLNGLFGRASQTTLSYNTTNQARELDYFSLSHMEVLNPEGMQLRLSYAVSESAPGTPALQLLNNESGSETLSIKLSYPFIRTRQENLTAHLAYEQKNTEGRSLNAITSEDRVRSLRVGVAYDNADAYEGINQALVEYSFGLRGLGAGDFSSPLKSRADGRPDYQKLTFNLSRNQQLGYFSPALGKFSLNAALMGQYSGTGLLSPEECGIGGQQFGRAYDSSEILGDQCLAASVELRYAAATASTPFKYAQFFTFYDGGFTRNINPVSAADPLHKSLSSAGLGVRFGFGEHVTGSLEVAKPLTRIVANEGDDHARIFANLSLRF